ncbi:MAG: endo alpha-1,4 polygalactosaminidase [Balneola sp.]
MFKNLILFYVGSLLINCTSAKKSVHNSMYDSFGVVYSEITPEDAQGYSFLIVEPYFYSREDIADFHSKGIKVVAYLSLGEVNESRKYFKEFKEIGFKGKNENHGSYYTDLTSRKVKDKFVHQIVPELLSFGYDGLFLDTIDAVSPYTIRREMRGDMIELIKKIRERNPSKILIQNAGFFILDETANLVDAIAVEDVASGYNFETNEYLIKGEEEFQERIHFINSLYKKNKIPFLIIDFSSDDGSKEVVTDRLKSIGFPYFISNIGFNRLPTRNTVTSKIKEEV